MAKKTAGVPRKRNAAKARPRRASSLVSNAALEPLALEFYGVARRAFIEFGLPVAEQRRLFNRDALSPSTSFASEPILDQFNGLSDLIAAWIEEMPYLDDTGKPRVLPISGRGATFESLAREFLPEEPLSEAVDLACRCASVGKLPGDRIALYGDAMVNFASQPDGVLAETVLHFREIIGTCLSNMRAANGTGPTGRMERIVRRVISQEEFEQLEKVIRPQMHDLCERVDRLLKAAAERSAGNRETVATAGIGVYVYQDDAKPPATKAGARKHRLNVASTP